MREADGFDVIHNSVGSLPLLLNTSFVTPVLTTIQSEIKETEVYLYKKAPGTWFFVAQDEAFIIPGVSVLEVIRPDRKDFINAYITIYDRIIQASARHDRRPWGFYEVLSDNEPDHKVKRITVWPQKRLSLQFHKRRQEHWVIVSGRAMVTVGENKIERGPSESIDIPRGEAHRVENIGDEPLVFIEVQQGDYFGEDDIVRLEDDYGRA
ncbi:MAG: cupin domain-containing protein [Deltaproteobacteria bacterium]|nr:cupin domain-containing protein [Deltaproteobacteria bacterium]